MTEQQHQRKQDTLNISYNKWMDIKRTIGRGAGMTDFVHC